MILTTVGSWLFICLTYMSFLTHWCFFIQIQKHVGKKRRLINAFLLNFFTLLTLRLQNLQYFVIHVVIKKKLYPYQADTPHFTKRLARLALHYFQNVSSAGKMFEHANRIELSYVIIQFEVISFRQQSNNEERSAQSLQGRVVQVAALALPLLRRTSQLPTTLSIPRTPLTRFILIHLAFANLLRAHCTSTQSTIWLLFLFKP